jgi:hydroxymethylbilane synthase
MISLRAVVGTPAGELLRASRTGAVDEPDKLGRDLAAELLELGGALLAIGAERDREHGR